MILVGTAPFFTVQASNDIIGIITSDTTWTKAGSPYTLKGPTAVNTGVTLTIEPGVTVNLNKYYIQVNGTLTAKGADNDKIYFNDGQVIFTSVSNGWNEQTGSGSIIQNAVFRRLHNLRRLPNNHSKHHPTKTLGKKRVTRIFRQQNFSRNPRRLKWRPSNHIKQRVKFQW